MKKFISITALLLVLICFIGCSEKKEKSPLDTSDMKNPFTFSDFAIDLPEGFYVDDAAESGDIPSAYAPDYPKHRDNYTFTELKTKRDPNAYTQAELDSIYSEALDNYSGLRSYDQTECCGFKALKIHYTATAPADDGSEITVEQHQFFVFTDDNAYIVTFSTDNKDYLDAYEASLDTILVQ